MQELQKDHDTFGAVVGEEDGFQFLVGATVYSNTITRLKGYGTFWRFAELVLKPMFELVDEFICYGDWLFAERHQLIHSAGRADGVPIIVDLVELDEQVTWEQ